MSHRLEVLRSVREQVLWKVHILQKLLDIRSNASQLGIPQILLQTESQPVILTLSVPVGCLLQTVVKSNLTVRHLFSSACKTESLLYQPLQGRQVRSRR